MNPSIRPNFGAWLALAAPALGACASLDPTDELEEAQRLVETRADLTVDWHRAWTPGSTPWPPSEDLGPDDVAKLALTNHPRIRATIESIVRARADFVQSHLLPNPIINFTLGLPIDGGSGHPAMGSLLQPIAALWQRPAAVDASESRLRAAVLALSDMAIQLVAEARSAHASAVFAERDLALERSSLKMARDALELVERRLAEGEASALDRNRAALDCVEAEMRSTEAEVRHDRATRALLETCGVAEASELPRLDADHVPVPDWVDRLSEMDLLDLSRSQRLDLAAAEALADGAIDDVRLAELRAVGSVSLGATYQRNFQGRDAIGPTLSLEIPIFDDGRAKTASAESMARAARVEHERIRQAAFAEVRQAWVRLRGDLAHLDHVSHALVDLAKSNRELADASLAAGIGDRIAALDFARREVRARLERNRVQLAVIRSWMELQRAVGGRIEAPRPEAER